MGRETISLTLNCFSSSWQKGVELLSDLVCNSVYNESQIEAEKDTLYRNALNNANDQMDFTLENVHYTVYFLIKSYRDHFIGQPVLGIRENIHNIKSAHIQDFLERNICGSNTVISVVGNVNHDDVANSISKLFGGLRKDTLREVFIINQRPNTEKPLFTPSVIAIRDDEMANANIGIFFNSPTWKDPDFFAVKLLQSILGDYRADRDNVHLNSCECY